MDNFLYLDVLVGILITPAFWAQTIRLGTPLLFPTLGEIICERAGILNLGVEGIMIVGTLAGYMGALYSGGNAWIGFFIGMAAGGIFSLIHGFLTITLKSNQVISGVMLVLLGIGVSGFINTSNGISLQFIRWSQRWGFDRLEIPFFGDIPFLGQALFQHDLFVYIAVLMVPLVWMFLNKTHLGIAITASGESPETADTLGINVASIRYLCVFLGGLFAGAGGAYLSLSWQKSWQPMMTAGRGWIAVVLVIFAFWKPQRAIWGAYLFGGIESLQIRLQTANVPIPVDLISTLPYLITIMVLVFLSRGVRLKRIGAPTALGVPYERGGR